MLTFELEGITHNVYPSQRGCSDEERNRRGTDANKKHIRTVCMSTQARRETVAKRWRQTRVGEFMSKCKLQTVSTTLGRDRGYYERTLA